MSDAPARLTTFLSRHRVTIVVALVIALATSGTVAAVSYLVLGATNTSGATTGLKSGVNGAVLQLTNTNATGGTSARGLGITVPAGRAPLTVSTGAGKVRNLDADKLDGVNGAAFARGRNVTTVANRRVLTDNAISLVLVIPGLGQIVAWCYTGRNDGDIIWSNTTGSTVDAWTTDHATGVVTGQLVPPNENVYFDRFTTTMTADSIVLGIGNDPGSRRTATVAFNGFRTGTDAPCGVQATATIWTTP